jgi:WD40 repeat protein/nucleoside phosphorylase/uncharacterized protein YjbI with pentapeptide repeats
MTAKPAPLPTSAALAALAQLARREVISKSDLHRLQTLAQTLPQQTHRLDVRLALPLLFGADTTQTNAETSLRKLAMRLRDQQAEAVDSGKMPAGELLDLQIERKNAAQTHQLWFTGQVSASAEARTHDLEGAGPLYENPALAPELLGNAAKGCEPILLLTVNDNETEALFQVFSNEHAPQPFLREDYPYQLLGHVEQRPIIAYRCQMGSMRNGAALIRTVTAIHHHRPATIIAVGIAFGKRDKQTLGDVLVSEQVQTYESERHSKDDSHTWRAESVPAASRWLERCMQFQRRDFKTHKGLLLCGEKLLDNQAFRTLLSEDFPTAIGGDMESAGLVTACHEKKVDWIVVKGVSDWGDGSKADGAEESKDALQRQAAINAAQVVYSALFLKPAPGNGKKAGVSKRNRTTPAPTCAEPLSEARTADFVNLNKVIELRGHSQSMAQSLASAAPDASQTQAQTSAHQTLLQWLADDQAPPVFALLGEYGMGKTVSCQRLYRALRELRQQGSAAAPAPAWAREPLYFDLRQLSLFKNMDRKAMAQLPSGEALINDLITHGWSAAPGQPLPRFADVQTLLAQGGLLIMDGLDECLVHLTEPQHPQFVNTLLNLVADAARNAAPERRPRLLLSCRTNFFKTLGDQRNLFTGQHRGKVDQAWYQALVLLPLTPEQIDTYLAAVLPGLDLARVQDLIARTHNLGELAQRPMTLKLLGEHIPELEALRERGEPVNGAALYGLVAKKWLERDEGKHHLEPEHKMRLMPALAAHLWRSAVRSIGYEELHGWFHQWRASQPDLTERYGPAAYNQTKLEEDLRTATFVVRQDEDNESDEGFRFAHSSLGEFFLARHLADAVLHDRPDDWALPNPSAETLHFLAEILQLEQARLQRKYPRQPETAERLQMTLNRWRTSYRAQASELLLAYALAPSRARGGKPAPDAPRPLLAGFDLAAAQLRGWAFGTATPAPGQTLLAMQGCKFAGADLREAQFDYVRLDDGDFAGALLERAALQHCSLRRASLPDAALTGTVLRQCALEASAWQPWGANHRAQFVACSGAEALGEVVNQPGRPFVFGDGNDIQRLSHTECDRKSDQHQSAYLTLLDSPMTWVRSVVFSRDGSRIASAADDGTVRLWDTISGECLSILCGHTDSVLDVAFSPDGARIVSASHDKTLRIWDASTEKCLSIIDCGAVSNLSAVFSPDGARIASASADGKIRLWDAVSGNCLSTLSGHTDRVLSVAFAPDGARIASSSGDCTLRLWNAASGKCLSTLKGHSDSVWSVAYSPDGTHIVSASSDHTIRIWDVASKKCLSTLKGHTNSVRHINFSPDGSSIASASADHTIRLWDTASGECLSIFSGHSDIAWHVSFSPDATCIVSASADNTIRLWNTTSGECQSTLTGHIDKALIVAFTPDGTRIASAANDVRKLRFWDTANGTCLSTLSGNIGMILSIAFTRAGPRIASGSVNGTIWLWDAASGARLTTLSGHTDRIWSGAFTADGTRIVSASADHTIRLWDTTSGKCLSILSGHTDSVWNVAFTPDGRSIASAHDNRTIRLWNAASGACLSILRGHTDSVLSIAFTPDGSRIASASADGTIRLWDAANGACVSTLIGHTKSIWRVAFSPNGARIGSASDDHTIRLWDTLSGACLLTLSGHTGKVKSIGFAPDGARIASASADGTIRLWDAASGACLRIQWANADSHASWRPARPGDPADGGELLSASGDAWRVLAWRVFDHPCAPGEWTRLPLQAY